MFVTGYKIMVFDASVPARHQDDGDITMNIINMKS